MGKFMMWFKAIFRGLVMRILAAVIIPIPLLYAQRKDLGRLPWGLDPIFGCMEDGYDGTGRDPDNIRRFWKNVDGVTIQGWWADHLGVIWNDLPWYKQWWYGYRWQLRNVAWNLRLRSWFGESIHFEDIRVAVMAEDEGEGKHRKATYIWYTKDGKERYFKRRKLFGMWWEYGWEFYPTFFKPNHPEYIGLRERGYTFGTTPFKQYSIPSIRPRR